MTTNVSIPPFVGACPAGDQRWIQESGLTALPTPEKT